MKRCLALLAAGALWSACGGAPPGGDPSDAGAPEPVLAPRLPSPSGPLAPAETEFTGARASGKGLADVERCAPCHAEIVSEWKTSAHAFASFDNPIYRAAVEALRSEKSNPPSRMCAGCHDPALLVDGAMDVAIDPSDLRARAGVTCGTCHGIVAASADGNGSYVLRGAPIELPSQAENADERARHVASAASSVLRTAELCASCHRAFLTPNTGNAHFLAGADDFGPWARSAYAGSDGARIDPTVAERDCRSCHMPRARARLPDAAARRGQVASHRFLGGHSWLAAMRGDAEALRRIRSFLSDTIRVDIVAIRGERVTLLPLQRPTLRPGTRVLIDVVLENRSVGHHFPGGTRDIQDTWLELEVHNASGKLLAKSDPADDVHRLKATLLDRDGAAVGAHATFRFESTGFDNTIAPRDSRLVRYALDLPQTTSENPTLRLTAVLWHRSRDGATQAAACREARSARGKAFGRALGDRALDPCVPQPVSEIARAEADLAREPEQTSGRARRLLAYGRALSGNVLEHAGAAREPLEAALVEAEREHDDATRAAALLELGQLAAREDRSDDALRLLDRAERLFPNHPAIESVRGNALSRVWRWSEAVPPLRAAAERSPRDDSAWAALGVALGSAHQDEAALGAAQRGLASAPRSEPLLRVQALALGRLAPSDDATRALDAYLLHREADVAPGQRRRCERATPGCAREKLPVHVHVLARAQSPELVTP
jgi:tetratricopeptide (TPR) repeat protein